MAEQLIKGIVEGCRQADCALIGGETAEMPGFYPDWGIRRGRLCRGRGGPRTRSSTAPGWPLGSGLVGLASSGLHSNGYSLVRKIVILELRK